MHESLIILLRRRVLRLRRLLLLQGMGATPPRPRRLHQGGYGLVKGIRSRWR